MRTRVGASWLGLLALLVPCRISSAFYLDDAHRFDVRVRAYSQLSVMTERSEGITATDRADVLRFTYSGIAASRKASLGAFRAHDMLSFRVTTQFN